MPKVVGKDPKHIFKVTCTNCASILEFTLSEVCTDRDGWYFDCPECTNKINDPWRHKHV